MIDFERQIHDYYDRIVIPVTTDEYTRLATGTPVVPRRSRAWVLAAAFSVVFVGVGITILFLGGNRSSFVDQPSGTTVTSAPATGSASTAVTHESTATTTGQDPVIAGWERVAAGEPWVEYIVDMEAIPHGGGFLIRAAEPWSVLWSPDGVVWSDADPNRQVAVHQWGTADGRTGAQVIAATSDRVVVLDRIEVGVWVGDPQDGVWEQILFDTDELAGQVELQAVESNGKELLVLASVSGLATLEDETVNEPSPIPGIDQYLVWVVDPTTGSVDRYPLPIAAHWGRVDDTVVEWFNGRWVIYLARQLHEDPEGRTEEESLLVSTDGVSWTKTAASDWGMSLTSLTAGSTTMVATVCNFGGDSFYFSDDGLNWSKTTSADVGHHSAYSDELGFVVVYGGSNPMLVSPDGQSWRTEADTPVSGVDFLEASGDTLLVGDGLRPEETPGLWLWTSE